MSQERLLLSRCRLGWTLEGDAIVFGVDIPAGFRTDGASVPRPFWWVLHPAGLAFEAAIVHDWRIFGESKAGLDTDREFYHNLRKCGIGRTRALIAYAAVRSHTVWVRGVWT